MSFTHLLAALRSDGYVAVNRTLSKSWGPEKAFWLAEFISIYMYRISKNDLNEGYFFIVPEKWKESNGMTVSAFRRISNWAEKEGYIHTRTKGLPPKKYYKPTEKLYLQLIGLLDNPQQNGDGTVSVNPDIRDSHLLGTDNSSSRNRENIDSLKETNPPVPLRGTSPLAGGKASIHPNLGVTGNPSPAAKQKIIARRKEKQQDIVEKIFDIWKDTKPLDDSRGRARKHIDKLLKSGVRIQRIDQAAVNYLNAQWVTAEKKGEEKPNGEFVRKVGNFFGRDGEWEDWTDDKVDKDLLEIRYK